jgi:DNA repair protein RadC
MNTAEGHRERLRQKFKEHSHLLTDTERLELLLMYAIPRKDVAPLAEALIARFGSVHAVVAAAADRLAEVPGIGASTAAFFQLLNGILVDAPAAKTEMSPAMQNTPSPQLNLFELAPEPEKPGSANQSPHRPAATKTRHMRVFANDEIANSLAFLPRADSFQSLEDFKRYLYEKLPYNASETRMRRAHNILERLYPEGQIRTPLTYFASRCSSKADLQPVIFYHILKAEPLAAKAADEFIWPALPIGRIERAQMREFILRYRPDAGESSQNNMLRALFSTYDLLGIGSANKTILRFQLHKGTLESFLYILTSEFNQPGINSFEALYSGPMHRWLLWDREWMRMQLYNLQDFSILSKVSEIDTVRQFTLAVDQPTALRLFFEHPERRQKAIREQAEHLTSDQES